MLYKKNNAKSLDKELFKNPTCEYRGTPFWAWNCKLEQEELERQIDVLREMGFGGFHMHVRTGMDTPYLSDEYMSLIRACVDKAERDKMLAWLYDEDRWPSGAAGGVSADDGGGGVDVGGAGGGGAVVGGAGGGVPADDAGGGHTGDDNCNCN